MTKESILEAQDFLRVRTEDGFKRIIDIESLLNNHSPEEVIDFLKSFKKEKEKSLRSMIQIDKSHKKVDQIVGSMFRVSMAIHALENGKEVIRIERPEQGAKKSCKFHKRDSVRHRDTWERQDKNHGGKNRVPGEQTKRAA